MWCDAYIGKPWAPVPDPPRSFSCGELVRHLFRERLGIDMPAILANAGVLRECIADIATPARYGLAPLPAGASPQEFDVAYMVQATRQNHVGLAVDSPDGLLILHCVQGAGVVLNSPAELLGVGFRRIDWCRHHLLGGESCPV